MSKAQKVEFLKMLEAGLAKISDLKVQTSAVIIYDKKGNHHIQGIKGDFSIKEIEKRTKGMAVILFLPDNGRELKML